MAKKVMRLVDSWTGLMECKVCGAEHVARIKPMSGGQYYRGAWQCQYGCELPGKGELLEKLGTDALNTSRTAR